MRSVTTDAALKEWAVVVEAMAWGHQLLLVRKGGIRDAGGGFDLKHREFLLYPTLEHQKEDQVRPEFGDLFERSREAASPQPGRVRFSLCAGVAFSMEVKDLSRLAGLEKYHIWAPSFFEERARYRPQAPFIILVVRPYRLSAPVLHPVRPEEAGCRSWVSLPEPVSLENAEPVQDNRRFRAALEEIHSKLEG